MTTIRPSFLIGLMLICASGSAQYSGPESVEYDAAGDRYLVSNTGDQTIKQRALDGTVTPFASTPGSPYGIEIQGEVVYACIGGTVKGYALANGTPVFDLNVGGTFLNGITSDGTYLYATDFTAKKVFKVDVAGASFTELVSNTVSTPNGIVWDAVGDRLVMVSWGSNAAIKSVDRNTGVLATLTTTNLGNIDGITMDCLGNFIVATWSPNQLTRFDAAFSGAGTNLGAVGLSHPADIDFDPVHHVICVPNASGNTVTLVDVDCTTAIAEEPAYRTINAIPNPTDGLIRLDLEFSAPQPFMVYNTRGLLVASGTLKPNAYLDVSSLDPGVYTIDLARLKRYVRVVKR